MKTKCPIHNFEYDPKYGDGTCPICHTEEMDKGSWKHDRANKFLNAFHKSLKKDLEGKDKEMEK